MEQGDGGGSATRALAAAAIALAGLAFSLTPVAARLDGFLLDAGWQVLRRIDSVAVPDDIVIVGIDEASVRAIPEPPALWHRALGVALARLAAARPRAIALDFPLPERSFDPIHAGLDRALFDGLATAVEGAPFVATLQIDARTRAARTIHKPFLALLGESRLGLSLIARDADGAARRFSLLVPTEDGGFPTLVGRLCRALKADCVDGLIHFGLGKPFAYVPLKNLLGLSDEALARGLFRDRIVLIGETLAYTGRIEAPVNLAGWEPPGRRDTPEIVLQAQTLRTALSGAAPRDASRPLGVVLVSAASLLILIRNWRMGVLAAVAATLMALLGGVLSLRAGLAVPLSAPLAALALAGACQGVLAHRRPAESPR